MDGKEHGSHKVLIIGGGFTGVMAAVELEKLGVDYRLLEAHPDRLGGRAYSYAYMPHTKAPGGPVFEHGAQYIGHDQSEIWALANEYVKTSIVDGCAARAAYTDEVTVLAGKRYLYGLGDCLFGVDGLPPNIGVWNLLAALLLISEIQMMEQSVDVVEPWKSPEWVQALDAITVADWTGRAWIPDVTRDLVSMATQALLSVDPQEISALYFFWYCACNGGFLNEVNDAEDGPQQYYLSCGMDALVDAVVDRHHVREKIVFDSPVRSIELCKGGGVRVTAKGPGHSEKVWQADKVIVAMSPHTYGKLAYTPEPPAARKQLMSQRMGRTIKCQVFYKEPWWRDSHGMRYSGYAGCANFPLMWVMDSSTTDHAPPAYCLMTFTVASFVDELGPCPSKAAVTKLVTDTLAFLFNDLRAQASSDLFVDLVTYDWNENAAYSGGGPNTVFAPGVLTDGTAAVLNEPWEDKVFFASSETARKLHPTSTSPYWQPDPENPMGRYSDMRQSLGYMDGAIVSGRYVAHQVAKSLGLPGYDAGVDARPSPDAQPATTLPAGAGAEPPAFTREQVAAITGTLCETFYSSAALDIAKWKATNWATFPAAMMPWLAEVVGGALAANGLEPTPSNMQGLVGAACAYSTEDASKLPPAEQAASIEIQKLTAILQSLTELKSAEPFLPPA
jgi:monoamine oxidase